MYPKVSEEGSPWFNLHEDRQGAYYRSCCSLLYLLNSWLIFSLGKSIILVIWTVSFINRLNMDLRPRTWVEKTVHGMETHRLPGKEKFWPHCTVKKVILIGHERTHHNWFPWKKIAIVNSASFYHLHREKITRPNCGYLFSLFNDGISTFLSYLMQKPSL